MIIRNNNTGVEIGTFSLPNRVKPVLGVKTDHGFKRYAIFDNDVRADDFMQILAEFCYAERQEEVNHE